MREGVSLQVYLECVSCVLYVVIKSCGVQAGEGKGRIKFLKEECRESVWSGHGESKM